MPTPDNTLRPVHLARDWSAQSWRARPATQLPQYADAGELEDALAELSRLPPLVTSFEILSLKQQIADAQEGRRFLLQAV